MRVLLILPAEADPPEPCPADALVLARPEAWDAAGIARLRARPEAPGLYVRVAPGAQDLAAAMALRPDGIFLSRAEGAWDVARLGACIAVHEAELGLRDGATRILPVLGTARGVLRLGALPGSSPRLSGLAWDAADLARDLGVDSARDPDGGWGAAFAQARGGLLLAAAAAGLPAIETASPAWTRPAAEAARRDGFRGLLALDPAQAAMMADVLEAGVRAG